MGATFSRLKNWIAELLTYADLNAEIDNILNNLGPSGVDDYSSNATQMRTDTDPGESGSESLATSLAGEIERLRFAIREIKGSGVTYWYQSASTSLSELASALGSSTLANRISSGRTRTSTSQPLFLVPNGAALSVQLQGASTNFVYFIEGTQYTISTNVTLSSLTAAPSSNNTTLVNMPGVNSESWTKMLGEYGTTVTVDAMGSEITALVGKLAGFKVGTEYFVARVDSTTQLSNARRGYFFSSADAPIPREAFADNATITLMKLTWIFATAAGGLTAVYTNPTVSASEPSSPAFGDYWFDLTASKWKIRSLSSTWDDADATLVGITLQDTTNCVAARSFDFFKNHIDTNTLSFTRTSATVCTSQQNNSEVSVYGSLVKYSPDKLTWDITLHRDSGVSESASTVYFFYVKESGAPVISDLAPYDRTQDLRGLYHPFQPWRCIGQAYNNGSSDLVAAIDYGNTQPGNLKVTTQVASNALTVLVHANPLSPIAFNSFNTTDINTVGFVPCMVSFVVASGSTLGHSNNVQGNLFFYLLLSAGTPYGAIASSPQGPGEALTSTAFTGNDDTTALYAVSALTSVGGRLIAHAVSTQSTAGTWAAVPTNLSMFPPKAGLIKISGYTSGSGTHTVEKGCTRLRVIAIGGGGGGGGSGSANGSASGAGGDTTFGTLISAGGGSGGGRLTSGAAGGTATMTAPAAGISVGGGPGGAGGKGAASAAVGLDGGHGGGCGVYGGNGTNLNSGVAGLAGAANTGRGGSGGGNTESAGIYTGAGGGSGAYIDAWLMSPASSYAYAVGGGGTAGGAGTSGLAGGAGASGNLVVEEYFD